MVRPDPDKVDHTIIRLLRQDSRISNADLAGQIGLSPSSTWRRVRALEECGVIKRYTIDVDKSRIGLGFSAIVHVQLTRHDPDLLKEFIRQIQTKDEIRACYATTGRSDYHLHVLCTDQNAYNKFLEDFLFRIKAVSSAQTNVILRAIKE